jgi:hypothetical protein
MADDKHVYQEKCADYQSSIDTLIAWESKVTAEMSEDPIESAASKFKMVNNSLNLASYYLVISEISVMVLKKRNEDALNLARKSILKGITLLEEMVTPYLDVPYADYEEPLSRLTQIGVRERYTIVRKMGLAIAMMRARFGGDSAKWKWTMVELEGRFIAVAKNLIDLKLAAANTDLSSPNYEPMLYYTRRVKQLLSKGADMYREKYEMGSELEYDFNKGLSFLNALRYMHSVLGEQQEAETVKRKIDTWKAKLEADKKNKKT